MTSQAQCRVGAGGEREGLAGKVRARETQGLTETRRGQRWGVEMGILDWAAPAPLEGQAGWASGAGGGCAPGLRSGWVGS